MSCSCAYHRKPIGLLLCLLPCGQDPIQKVRLTQGSTYFINIPPPNFQLLQKLNGMQNRKTNQKTATSSYQLGLLVALYTCPYTFRTCPQYQSNCIYSFSLHIMSFSSFLVAAQTSIPAGCFLAALISPSSILPQRDILAPLITLTRPRDPFPSFLSPFFPVYQTISTKRQFPLPLATCAGGHTQIQ